jgi:hypothetical protein
MTMTAEAMPVAASAGAVLDSPAADDRTARHYRRSVSLTARAISETVNGNRPRAGVTCAYGAT